MDPTTTFCPNLACPARGQTGQGNLGIHSCKDKRFLCTECHKTFSATKGTAFYRLRTSAETVSLVGFPIVIAKFWGLRNDPVILSTESFPADTLPGLSRG